MSKPAPAKSLAFIRPLVRRLKPYVPGEQPSTPGLLKLNTNENPYPPSPKVRRAIRAAADDRLRLYPNPTAQPLRDRLAELHGCRPENVIIGNGSDELLALATRAFVEPERPGASRGRARSASTVQFFHPSYSLYPVLAAIHGAAARPVPLADHYGLPSPVALRRGGRWDFKAALTYVTTPHAPSGRGYDPAALAALCERQRGVVILDEAYVDFADDHALALALQFPHVIVSRTFSKSYSLCFQRVGYFVGAPALIGALDRVRDSYNVNGLGQIAALATLEDLPYYRRNFERIRATRDRTRAQLEALGWSVFPSQTNFLLARPPGGRAAAWLEALRRRRVLVRWFRAPEVRQHLRISIGSDSDMDGFLRAIRQIG